MIPLPICPICEQNFDRSHEDSLLCTGCGRKYAQTFAIPDLRIPPANGPSDEDILVQEMLVHYPQADFAELSELLDIRLRNAPTYHELRGHETGYMLQHAKRGREMTAMFHARLGDYFPHTQSRTALDIGCGMGAGLLALASMYEHVTGIDPSLPELILARKALESNGITNFQLVQAYEQHIPFPDQSFDYLNALNVLEHVFEVQDLLGEVYRLLRSGGWFAADSRIRFDLFFPEPHVKLRWVGFLPRQWAKRYIHWRLGIGYEVTRLLSFAELRKGMQMHFDKNYRIAFPYVSAYGGPAWLDGVLKRLEPFLFLGSLALWVFPSHLAIACRK